VEVGTYGTVHSYPLILKQLQIDGVQLRRAIWEYPPLPLIHSFVAGLREGGDYETVGNELGRELVDAANKLEREYNVALDLVLHASHVPICGRSGCVNPNHDYGRNLCALYTANGVVKQGRDVVVNYHMPKEQVPLDVVTRTVEFLASLADQNVLLTFEPQYTKHSLTLEETCEVLQSAACNNCLPALQLENEILRDFWDELETASSFSYIEEKAGGDRYWYNKLVQLYECAARKNSSSIYVPLFVRYAKVEPYKAFGAIRMWKKRVPLDYKCNMCGPSFENVAKGVVEFIKRYRDKSPKPVVMFVYTGAAPYHEPYDWVEETVLRARDLAKIVKVFTELLQG